MSRTSSDRGSPSMLYSTRPLRGASSSVISRTSAAVMCRSSARGCTVMPGAPASIQTRAASITDGTRPPRELRTVATLLTLTESLIMKCKMQNSTCKPQNANLTWAHDALLHLASCILHFEYCILHFELHRHSNVLADRIDDLLTEPADLGLVPAFQHHPQQRLGARIPHEQPPLSCKMLFDARHDAGDFRNRLEVHLLLNAQVHEHLRIRRQIRRQVGEGTSRRRHRPKDVERGG